MQNRMTDANAAHQHQADKEEEQEERKVSRGVKLDNLGERNGTKKKNQKKSKCCK